MLDGDDTLFRVIDLKQYLYCKRVWYYHACLPDVRPTTHKMQAGIDAHETEKKRAARRSLTPLSVADGIRHFDISLISRRLHLAGEVDEVIEVTAPSRALIPVDYKLSRQTPMHFQTQLAAYALMLEDQWDSPAAKGYLYLIPTRRTIEVTFSPSLRNTVRRALAEMQAILEREAMPPPTEHRQKCVDCEFRRFCNDVL